jgi:linoleoyl-CoA desaturase
VLGLVGGKAVFVGWALVAPLLVYPWWVVLAGYAAFTMAVSLVAATTFQLAHSVEGADTATPAEIANASRPWAVHQVEMTVDFFPRNPVLTWLLGGLNFQIEHHLFPRVQHTHYAHIAAIVQRNARDTESATRRSRRCGRRCARMRGTCGRWGAWACRSRSRWARRLMPRGQARS